MTSRIEAIAARLAAADTAEWDTFTYIDDHVESYLLVVEGRRTVATVDPGDRAAAVLEFLGAAPADIAWLVQEHHRLQSRVAYLEGWKDNVETRTEGTPTS